MMPPPRRRLRLSPRLPPPRRSRPSSKRQRSRCGQHTTPSFPSPFLHHPCGPSRPTAEVVVEFPSLCSPPGEWGTSRGIWEASWFPREVFACLAGTVAHQPAFVPCPRLTFCIHIHSHARVDFCKMSLSFPGHVLPAPDCKEVCSCREKSSKGGQDQGRLRCQRRWVGWRRFPFLPPLACPSLSPCFSPPNAPLSHCPPSSSPQTLPPNQLFAKHHATTPLLS